MGEEGGIRQRGRRWLKWAKVVLLLLLVLYVVVTAWLNRRPVELRIPLLLEGQASLALLVFVAFGAGAVAGAVAALLMRRRGG